MGGTDRFRRLGHLRGETTHRIERLKKAASLCSDIMAYASTHSDWQGGSSYPGFSGYAANQTPQYPITVYGALSPSVTEVVDVSPVLDSSAAVCGMGRSDSVAEHVFGPQLRHARASLEDTLKHINDRTRMHYKHLADIEHRHMKTQLELSGARLNGHIDGYKRATRLEAMLVPLEKEKRQEERDFWKDMMDVQIRMLDLAKEYRALRNRSQLLSSMGEGGSYG